MTIQDLLDAGYREYKHHKDGVVLYQKWIRKDGTVAEEPDRLATKEWKLYAINFEHYVVLDTLNPKKHPHLQASARFYLEDGTTFEFSVLFPGEKTLEQSEEHFSIFYRKMFCVPDIHNND